MLRGRGGVALVAALATTAAVPAVAPAQELPGDRVYEMVSPVDKNGAGVVSGTTTTEDGNAVNYSSFGTYAGAPGTVMIDSGLVARRTATGWTTSSLSPVVSESTSAMDTFAPAGIDESLTRLFANMAAVPLAPGDANGVADVYAGNPDRSVDWLTPSLTLPDTGTSASWYSGRSKDGRTIVVTSSKQLVPGVPGGTQQVYASVDGVLRLVSAVDGSTTVSPGASVLGWGASTATTYNTPPQARAVSEDGSRVVFSTTSPRAIYVRELATNRTTTVVAPGATNPIFLSASADASKIFFSSTSLLTPDAPTNGGLYQYDLADGTLTYLSKGSTGNVLLNGLVNSSADGRRVYFVARAQLNGEGVASSPNIYVAHAGHVDFVATLVAGNSEAPLWELNANNGTGESNHPARVNADGSRFLFATARAVPGYANGGFAQVYLYDADQDVLTCISCRPDGSPSKGAASLLDTAAASQGPGERRPRNLIGNGDQALFETTDALVPEDVDNKTDVYLWDGEEPVLISVGSETDGIHLVDNSPDGSSIFLRTRASLLEQDRDNGESDLYVARIGGGLPSGVEPEVDPCVGEACRPPQTPAPTAPGAASAAFSGPGNVVAPLPAPQPAAARLTVKRPAKATLTRWARTGRGSLTVALGKAGTVRVVAKAKIGGKQVTVAQGTARLKKAGSASVTLRLSAKARRALRSAGKLSVRLTVTSGATTTNATTTVVLRRAGSKR